MKREESKLFQHFYTHKEPTLELLSLKAGESHVEMLTRKSHHHHQPRSQNMRGQSVDY